MVGVGSEESHCRFIRRQGKVLRVDPLVEVRHRSSESVGGLTDVDIRLSIVRIVGKAHVKVGRRWLIGDVEVEQGGGENRPLSNS